MCCSDSIGPKRVKRRRREERRERARGWRRSRSRELLAGVRVGTASLQASLDAFQM